MSEPPKTSEQIAEAIERGLVHMEERKNRLIETLAEELANKKGQE